MVTQIITEDALQQDASHISTAGEHPRRPRNSSSRVAPLSFAQERLWFLDRLEPGLAVYNIPRAFRLRGPLDTPVLGQALDAIVRRHDSLRTTVGIVDGSPQQIVAPSMQLQIAVRGLENVPENERANEAARLAAEEAATPFDLERGPLLRVTLLRLGVDDHLLVITMHHIVSEGGWSMNIFLNELGSLYDAYSRGESSPLAPLPIQYADYARWQRGRLQGDLLERELSYWRKQLAGAPAALRLPADLPRPPQPSYRGARAELRLPLQLSDRIRALSRTEGVTVAMTLLAAWLALIARYTEQYDLVVGMPIAGRTRLETEELIGLFLNTLVLRVDTSGDPTFRELLARVRETTLAAYDYQDLPFERLVEALRPERVRNLAPVVQVMFAPQPSPAAPFALTGLDVRSHEVATGTTITDAMLFSWDEPSGIRLVLEYSTEIFEPDRMQRMLAHFQTILAGATASPALRLSALPLLTEAERYSLLVEWSAGASASAQHHCIHDLIEVQAARSPESVALIIDGERWTYDRLNRGANQLANHLRTLGVAPGVVVAIAADRSAEMVVGTLGILKAGGAYLPLDPAYPSDRLAFMQSDSGARVLLTHRRLDTRLPAFDGTVVRLDSEWEEIARQSAEAPQSRAGVADLAYVMYTSGSTGRPKGVQITHGALTNLLTAARDLLEPDSEDSLLAVTTLSFDIAGLELWLPLMVGARVVMANGSEVSDGARLAELLRSSHATIMQATPATWQLLLQSGWTDGSGLKALCGGEALSWKLASQLVANRCSLWNMYGPTETTIWSAAYPVPSSPGRSSGALDSVPIGRPLFNTEFYVLDCHAQLVPVGVPGELYIGGAGLARGYLNRPDLTAERFVPHPFSAEPGARLYRTGDRVRYRGDGTLEFLGRIDQQVKLRGHRIELGEIEAILREHPALRDAVVVLHEDDSRGPVLVAYVIGRASGELPLQELRGYLQQRLPRYMLPSAIIPVEEIPRTPGGKVDRRALRSPQLDNGTSRDRRVAPRDEMESRLVTLWERALDVEPIGVRDNFFELGGHSLLAARLFADMERTMGLRLPLSALFEAPTIEELAVMLRRNEECSRWSSLVPIEPAGDKPPLIFVHGMGGNILGYRNLARLLGPNQPCYGLQARGLSGEAPPVTRVEEMAANYNAELRAAWPSGPYALCGLSFGGTVAFEMARQLVAQGQPVALVALLDSCPSYSESNAGSRSLSRPVAHLLSVIAFHARALLSRSPREMAPYVRLQFRRLLRQTRSMLWRHRYRQRQKSLASGQSLPIVLQDVEESCRLAFRLYRPEPYSGRVTLFRATIRGADDEDHAAGWGRLAAGGIEIHDVPGSHITMMAKPHVAHLAEKLSACLAESFPSSLQTTEPSRECSRLASDSS